MKTKSLLLMAIAALVAMANISCGSDDEEVARGDDPVTLPQPEYAATAVSYEIPVSEVTTADGASLTALNFTESGKAVVEVTTADNSKKYATYDVTIDGSKYIITDEDGEQVGVVETATAQNSPRRASSTTSLMIYIEVTIPGLGTLTFQTAAPVSATKVAETIAATNNTANIARTWTVKTMKLVLEGDVSLAKTEHSGNLKVFADAAQEEGANLTASEMAALSKYIKYVTLDKTGMFAIEYLYGGSEACTWSWADAAQTMIKLNLRVNTEFGNKFLADNSFIHIDLNPSGCVFTLNTTITGSKSYKATMTMVLE